MRNCKLHFSSQIKFYCEQKLEVHNNRLLSDLPNSRASFWDWQIGNSPGVQLWSYFQFPFFSFQALLVTKRELFLQAVTNTTESALYRWSTNGWGIIPIHGKYSVWVSFGDFVKINLLNLCHTGILQSISTWLTDSCLNMRRYILMWLFRLISYPPSRKATQTFDFQKTFVTHKFF